MKIESKIIIRIIYLSFNFLDNEWIYLSRIPNKEPWQPIESTHRIPIIDFFSSVHEQELGRDNLLYTCSHVSTCSLDLDQSSTVTSLLNSKSLNRFTGAKIKENLLIRIYSMTRKLSLRDPRINKYYSRE